jgi:hypothetical protein
MNLEKWAADYRLYIRFQIETLPYAYQYGGMKFNASDSPSFNEFQENLNTSRCFITPCTATDFDLADKPTFHNVIKQSFRWDLYKCRILWKEFKGVRFNFKIFFENRCENTQHHFYYLAKRIKNGFYF